MAEPPNKSKPPKKPKVPHQPERDHFASAMAKAELGRFYWSERSERELRAVLAKKPRR